MRSSMNRNTRTAAAIAVGVGLALASTAAAAPASANSWNCRVVIADSVGFYAHSTGTAKSSPPNLGNGRRFKSFGVENGRFHAQISDPADGWVTADSNYVQLKPDSWCVW
jgi:hypothetical protein